MKDHNLSDIILDSMTDGVVNLDAKGVITAMNPAAAEILGLDVEQSLGSSYGAVFFTSEENDSFNQLLLDLVTTQEAQPYAEVPFTRDDGATRQLALTASLLKDPDKGRRSGAVLVFKDITSVHRLRAQRDGLSQELQEKHEELRQAYQNLEERNKTLQEAQRRVLWIKLGAGVLGVLFFAAVIVWMQAGGGGGGGGSLPPPEHGMDFPVETADGQLRSRQVTTGDILVTIPASGYIEPLRIVTVTSEVSGRVTSRLVELGERVKRGDILMLINPGEVKPKVREAEAALLKARQTVRELENWFSRPEYKQAKRSLELAELDFERKKRRFGESEALFKKGIIPRDEMDNSRSEWRRANSELAAAKERLATSREKASPDKLKVARLEFLNAQAALQEARIKLLRTEIKAPAEGVVMRPREEKGEKRQRIPEVGAKVNEGQALMDLGADRPLGVVAKVDEVAVGQIKLGQRAIISSQALQGRTLEGLVRAVAPQAELDDRLPTFPVLIELQDLPPSGEDGGLRLGMSASIRIIVKEAKDAVLAPVAAVGSREGSAGVRILVDGKPTWREIKTGISDREFVQVLEGLKPGQEILY